MAACNECGNRPSKKNVSSEETFIDLAPFGRMADGRAFTDYRSKCQKLTNMTSYDERMFLMNNAKAIIESTTSKFVSSKCASEPKPTTMLPEEVKQVCDKNSCKFVVNDKNGLGLGR